VQTTPVQPPRRSFKQKFGENSVNIPIPHNEDMEHEATLETKETEGSPARRPRTTAQAPPAVHPADDILQSFLSEGWKVHDLGGCGDCGYKSIAGALAYAKDGSILSPEEAQRQGALVRTQAVQHLRKHLNEFKEFILPDVNTSPSQPAPNQDQVVEQYVWESSQPNTWIDGVTLLAAAHKQGCPFIIWFSHEGYWKRCTLATAFDQKGNAKCARDKSPIILRLQDQYYSWIQPLSTKAIPVGWLSQSAIPHREVLRGSAVESSAATPSVHSWESQGSPSRPISPSQCQVLSPKGRSVEGPGTPSVHTVAGFPAGCRVLGRDVSVGTPLVHTVQTHAQAVPVLNSAVVVRAEGNRSCRIVSSHEGPPTPSVHTCVSLSHQLWGKMAPSAAAKSHTSLTGPGSAITSPFGGKSSCYPVPVPTKANNQLETQELRSADKNPVSSNPEGQVDANPDPFPDGIVFNGLVVNVGTKSFATLTSLMRTPGADRT